jgi:tetratricopeptide (TPR) repeat protein
MKRIMIITLCALVFLTACAAPRHKLSPQGNVNLQTAKNYYNLEETALADSFFREVLKVNPEHAESIRRIADINLNNGERFAEKAVPMNKAAYEGYDKAIKIMEKYDKPTEKELAAIRDMKKRRTSAWTRVYKAGETQEEAGNTQTAMDIFETVAALDTTRIEPLIKMKNIYQKDLKDEIKAEQILLKLYSKDQTDKTLLQEMGIFYMNKKDYAKAATFFEKVKVLEPTDVNNLMNLVYCEFEQELFADAKINNELVLGMDPVNIDALTDAKAISYRLNNTDDTLMYLKKLLEIRDNDKDFEDIAVLLNTMKKYEEMITYAKKWHNYDDTSKFAVQYVILGAQMTKNKSLETEYQNILKKMQ